MAHLRKRNNIWYIYYYDNGKLKGISTHTGERHIAKDSLIKLEHRLLNAKNSSITSDISWADFTQAYLAFAKTNKQPRSYTRDCLTFKTFNKTCEIRHFCDYSFQMLENYKSKRKESGVSEASINRELNTLKAAGKWAITAKYADTDPVVGVKKYKLSAPHRERFLTLAEIKTLLSKPKSEQVKTIVRLQLWGAMRIGEALHVAWQDIDFDKNLIYFTPKAGWQPKTKQKQVIPLNGKLKRYLLSLPKVSFYVCGEKPMRDEIASAVVTKCMRSLGITNASSHTLRHTAISWAAMSGMDFPSLVRFARHTNPAQTMQYTHLMPSYAQNQVDKLPY